MTPGKSAPHDRVVVTLATYRRPEMLARTLNSLSEQDYGGPFHVVVVDNDADATGRSVANGTDLDLRYVIEPVPGIASARNRCVSEAMRYRPDWIVFIDDDEWAEPTWLSELTSAVHANPVDGCQGWVGTEYAPGGPSWVRELGFHERARPMAGLPLRFAGTGNLIVRASLLTGAGPPFDIKLGLTGGEDTAMTARLVLAGAAIVTAPDAIVTETIPLDRQNLDWMRHRARRGTAGWADIERTIFRTPFWRTRQTAACLRDVAVGVGFVLLGFALSDYVRSVRGRIEFSKAKGSLLGLSGRQVEEYARRSTE